MEKAKTALASEAALTTKEGLVYEPGDAQKIKDQWISYISTLIE